MQTLILAGLALSTLAAPINASLESQADDLTGGTGDWKWASDVRDDVSRFFHRAEGRQSDVTLQSAETVALADDGIAFDGVVVPFDEIAYVVEDDTLQLGSYGTHDFEQSLTVTLS